MNRRRLKSQNQSYAVGYGRPPVHTRFQRGVSGNPGGRPRGRTASRVDSLILKEVYRPITVRDGDEVLSIPAIQAVIRGLIARAAKGNGPAQRLLIAFVKQIEQERADAKATGDNGPRNNSTPLEVRWLSHEEALEALDEAPTKIVRTIVDPNQETDLSQLTEPELTDLERLLFKARKAKTMSG